MALWCFRCTAGPAGKTQNAAHLILFLLMKKWMALDLNCHWKCVVHILVPFAICTTSDGYLISSRMAAIALAGSVLCWLARGHAQAYCENMSMQQNRYLVMPLASLYCSRPGCTAVGTQGWTGHDGLPPEEGVSHGMLQRITLLSGQGLPDGGPHQGLHIVWRHRPVLPCRQQGPWWWAPPTYLTVSPGMVRVQACMRVSHTPFLPLLPPPHSQSRHSLCLCPQKPHAGHWHGVDEGPASPAVYQWGGKVGGGPGNTHWSSLALCWHTIWSVRSRRLVPLCCMPSTTSSRVPGVQLISTRCLCNVTALGNVVLGSMACARLTWLTFQASDSSSLSPGRH